MFKTVGYHFNSWWSVWLNDEICAGNYPTTNDSIRKVPRMFSACTILLVLFKHNPKSGGGGESINFTSPVCSSVRECLVETWGKNNISKLKPEGRGDSHFRGVAYVRLLRPHFQHRCHQMTPFFFNWWLSLIGSPVFSFDLSPEARLKPVIFQFQQQNWLFQMIQCTIFLFTVGNSTIRCLFGTWTALIEEPKITFTPNAP